MSGPRSPLLRDRRDLVPVVLALWHAVTLCLAPPWPVVGVLMWWNANTIAHQATHRRMFTARAHEAAFAALLTLLLGAPHQLFRQRHRAHHLGRRAGIRWNRELVVQSLLLLVVALALGLLAPAFLLGCIAPGLAMGLLLCALHGRGEHLGGVTIRTRGRLWNLLFLNDGFHAEHHRWPGMHFRDLPRHRTAAAATSVVPPPLRALSDAAPWALDRLERLVLRSKRLQRIVLAMHRPALARLLAAMPAPSRVMIVGGGLFPRTALLLRELLPQAEITVLDAEPAHLRTAARLLPASVRIATGTFVPGQQLPCDLAVLPLALRGDRARCYREPPAPHALVHDWAFRRRGAMGIAVPWLGKRVNLVRQAGAPAQSTTVLATGPAQLRYRFPPASLTLGG